jgi:hypothetical protein
MSDNIQRLESEAFCLLLDGDDPVLAVLRQQLAYVVSIRREYNLGFCVYFTLSSDAPRLPGGPSFAISDVYAEIEGVDHGAGFVLFVADGHLSMLEANSFGDSDWPDTIGNFQIQYVSGAERDLTALHQTLNWPDTADG